MGSLYVHLVASEGAGGEENENRNTQGNPPAMLKKNMFAQRWISDCKHGRRGLKIPSGTSGCLVWGAAGKPWGVQGFYRVEWQRGAVQGEPGALWGNSVLRPLEAEAAPLLLQKSRCSCKKCRGWGWPQGRPQEQVLAEMGIDCKERDTEPVTTGPPELALAERGTKEQCALQASGGSRPEQRWHLSDLGEEGAGSKCVPSFIYLFGWLGCDGGSGNFLGQCTSVASRATLASPADPSGERHQHCLWRGLAVPGSLRGALPGSSGRLPAPSCKQQTEKVDNPLWEGLGWVENILRHFFSPSLSPTSQRMCRHQKATLSSGLWDWF